MKEKNMKIPFVGILLIGSAVFAFSQEINNIKYHGYILPKDENKILEFTGKHYNQFQLEIKDIEIAEKILENYMRENNKKIFNKLGKYERQYIGLESQGHKIVYINLFMKIFEVDKKNLLNSLFFVRDGGDSFFQIYIDITSNFCFKIFINGEA
jgi:hypothetical protein